MTRFTPTQASEPDVETLFHEGNQYLAAGDLSLAENCFHRALAQAPETAELHANLGLVQERQGRAAAAEASYRKSIALNPGLAQIHGNLGVLLVKQKRLDEAGSFLEKARDLDPDSAVVWSNLGVLHACGKREADAEACYRKAMALDVGYARARFNLSYLLLRQGGFEAGWQCLEFRPAFAALEGLLACPRWRGEPLEGKSILIGLEAGHGDMIQFSRYADVLKAQGAARVDLLCHPALTNLFASLSAVDAIVAPNEFLLSGHWDYWVPPMSIPHYCRTRQETIPAALPYLHADPERMETWQRRLPASELKVGLAWRGNPRHENDADRSLPLSLLEPLGDMAGVQFISLQKGAGEDEALSPPAGLALQALGHEISDFADTAAIIAQLDLVVCIDSAVAHLAGALGKPCWVLLPDYKTDWRWLTERTDSPWYPGVMRLFRQSSQGGWAEVIAEVRGALQEWALHRL